MKKFILLLISMIAFVSLQAQERTLSKTISSGGTYMYFDEFSSTLDVVKATTNDTLDFKIKYEGAGYVSKVSAHIQLDTIDNKDTVSVQLLGYDYLDDTSANVIISPSTSIINSTLEIGLVDDYMSGADELSFRYYVIRIIRTGKGNGCRLKETELKLYVQ